CACRAIYRHPTSGKDNRPPLLGTHPTKPHQKQGHTKQMDPNQPLKQGPPTSPKAPPNTTMGPGQRPKPTHQIHPQTDNSCSSSTARCSQRATAPPVIASTCVITRWRARMPNRSTDTAPKVSQVWHCTYRAKHREPDPTTWEPDETTRRHVGCFAQHRTA